jgi:hypothetical protein
MTRFIQIRRALAAVGPIFLSALLIGAQEVATVDATGHLRLRSKVPETFARGGPLQPLTSGAQTLSPELVSVTTAGTHPTRQAVFELKLLNRSSKALVIPVDPNSADFDPLLASSGLSHLEMLQISLVPTEKAAESCTVDGYLKLLGDRSVSRSLHTLQPGQWVRVKGVVRLSCRTESSAAEFKDGVHAVVSLGSEEIVTQKGGLQGTETIQSFVISNPVMVGGARK